MNYLLIMPRFVDKVGEWYHFPLGIPYVSASLKKAGFRLFTLNMNNVNESIYDTLKTQIINNDIDVVLTGGLSFQYNAIKDIIAAAKKIKENIITIVGGGIITSAPEPGMEVLEFVDYGIIGEGEITTCELCQAIENVSCIEAVNGIIYYDDKRNLLRTMPRQEIDNLDDIPFPDYDGFGFNKIMECMPNLLGINEAHAITMSSSRSCPFQCTFCFHTSGSRYRKRSLDNFFAELDILVEKYNVKYIFVSDELFAYNLDRVKEFCEKIKPYNIKWWAQFRVCDVTEEMVKILKDSNCVTMGFGIESADDGILKSMHKGIKFEQTERALELAYQYGITIQGGFIFGDVEETIETATKTLNWWKEHPEYGITLNFITAFPGTPLYKYAVKNGIIKDEVQFIKDGCPVVNLSKMNKAEMDWLAEQVIKLPQKAFLEPLNIRNVKFNAVHKSIGFDGECTDCGIENHWNNVRFFTRNVLTCKKCGKKHKLPILKEIIKSINVSIENLVYANGKVAFWGINDYFANILSDLDSVLNSEQTYLIDNSRIKQGSIVNGKLIYAPSIIAELDIKVVVIPVISLVTTIENQICNEYKNVKKIINILDLIK